VTELKVLKPLVMRFAEAWDAFSLAHKQYIELGRHRKVWDSDLRPVRRAGIRRRDAGTRLVEAYAVKDDVLAFKISETRVVTLYGTSVSIRELVDTTVTDRDESAQGSIEDGAEIGLAELKALVLRFGEAYKLLGHANSVLSAIPKPLDASAASAAQREASEAYNLLNRRLIRACAAQFESVVPIFQLSDTEMLCPFAWSFCVEKLVDLTKAD
jgi:hypothetical protein